VRRRRRLFAGHDRLHLHGEEHQLHVRHRAGRGEDRDNEVVTARELGGASVHATLFSTPTARSRTTSRRCADAPADRLLALDNTDGVPEWRASTTSSGVDMSLDPLSPTMPNKPYDMEGIDPQGRGRGRLLRNLGSVCEEHRLPALAASPPHVGFVANQPMVLAGVLDSDASRKPRASWRFCDAFNIPIVTFVDVPGFCRARPGIWRPDQAWRETAVRLSQCTVPLVTVITRKAYGGAFDRHGLKGDRRRHELRLADRADRRDGRQGRRLEIIFRADIGDAEKIAARTREYEDRFLSPFIAAERGYIDDVIKPHSTRRRIARALAMLRDKHVEMPMKKREAQPVPRRTFTTANCLAFFIGISTCLSLSIASARAILRLVECGLMTSSM